MSKKIKSKRLFQTNLQSIATSFCETIPSIIYLLKIKEVRNLFYIFVVVSVYFLALISLEHESTLIFAINYFREPENLYLFIAHGMLFTSFFASIHATMTQKNNIDGHTFHQIASIILLVFYNIFTTEQIPVIGKFIVIFGIIYSIIYMNISASRK
ncbi:hypothetical protein [Aminiphilus circumscriptus]|uniref:hypothetical protein n=1 Tax=Aminiphilus circumscriptus TaxID=290732 RepID=UPI0012FA39EB|nr:hypothetical protein [Aminiphilus circumscriptus]